MTTELWTMCALKIGTAVIGQLTDQSYDSKMQEFLAIDGGSVYPRDVGVDSEDCRFKVTTTAVKAALAAVGVTGTALTVAAPAVLYYQAYAAGGTRVAGGCKTITISKGIVVLRNVSSDDKKLGSVQLEVIGVSTDGTTAPYALASNVALPTFPTAEMWCLGGTNSITKFSIDFGIKELLERSDNTPYYTLVTIDTIQPKVSYSSQTFATLGPLSTMPNMTLQAVTSAGTRGAGTIVFAYTKFMNGARKIGGGPVSNDFEGIVVWDGTNAPITIAGLT